MGNSYSSIKAPVEKPRLNNLQYSKLASIGANWHSRGYVQSGHAVIRTTECIVVVVVVDLINLLPNYLEYVIFNSVANQLPPVRKPPGGEKTVR